MTAYPDYSNDWALHPGVQSGTVTFPTGAAYQVHVRPDVLSYRDIAGGIVGLSPGDKPWILWGIAVDIPDNSSLVVGSVTYLIIGSELRGDLGQQRIFTRKAV